MPDIAEIDHFSYGLITPGLAYALSVLGALLGLTCTAKARAATTAGRRAWFLLLAAWAIGGTGIWVMHFMAMLGFGVDGSEIRYDVPITTASAIIAISVVAVGLFTAGTGRVHLLKILLGGVFTGLGVAAMHYTGMAAMRIDGVVVYDDTLVAASIAIAVVAATVALWFTVAVRKPVAIVAAALVMGVAVCGMHYTGMYAMEVHLHGLGDPLTGSTSFGLILPIVLLVIFVVIGLVYAVIAAPTDEDRDGVADMVELMYGRPAPAEPVAPDPVGLAGRRDPGPAAGPPPPPAPGGPGPSQRPGFGPVGNGQPGADQAPSDRVGLNGRPIPTTRRQSIPRAARRPR